MAGAGKKWAIGCGVGCAVIALIFAGFAVFGTLWVRDTFKGFEDATRAREDLEERFGRVNQFTPSPDGAIPAARVEAFLAVRDATAGVREQLAEKLSAIPMSASEARELDAKPAGEKARSILGIIGSAFGLGAEMGNFFDARNSALLEQEMGMGEYTYLYTLSYYVFLGHSPEDGPGDEREADDHMDVDFGGATDARRIHGALLSMLRNQMQGLAPDGDEAHRAALEQEIAAMKSDRRRFPWKDGLPAATADSFAPFRERLAASYDPVSNPFELAVTTKKGLSITAD